MFLSRNELDELNQLCDEMLEVLTDDDSVAKKNKVVESVRMLHGHIVGTPTSPTPANQPAE